MRSVINNKYKIILTLFILLGAKQSYSGKNEFAYKDDQETSKDEQALQFLKTDPGSIPDKIINFPANEDVLTEKNFNLNSGTYRLRAIDRFPDTPRRISTEKWLHSNQLINDWFDIRSDLEGNGVDINGQYTFAYLANVYGGVAPGGSFDDQLQLGIDMNFGKLFKSSMLKNTQFSFDFIHAFGADESANYVGNIFTVSQAFVDQGFYLDEMYLLQGLYNREYWFKIGRLNAGNDFLVSDLYCVFVNSGFCGNPSAVIHNGPWSTPPNAQWGILLGSSPIDEFIAKLGVYNTNLNSFKPNSIGSQFSFSHSQGANIMTSISYLRNQDDHAPVLSGIYTIGGIYFTGRQNNDDFTVDPNGAPGNSLGGVYFEIEQTLFSESGSAGEQGLSGFLTSQVYNDWDVTVMPLFLNIGLVYTGVFDVRPKDQLALGGIYGRFGQDAIEFQGANFGYEVVIELTYRFNFTNWFFLQPDLQYIIHPFGGSAQLAGTNTAPENTFVIGFQGGFNL